MRPLTLPTKSAVLAAVPLLLISSLVGCGGDDDAESADLAAFTLRERLLRTEIPVAAWTRSEDLAEAHAGAEAAANLIVGSEGSGYGDRDGDNVVNDEDVGEFGVLPSLDGTPPGLAEAVDNECVEADVLAGSWDDPAARWAELDAAVAAWSPDNDTVAALASHPMRIVGWAMLSHSTDVLSDVRDFGNLAAIDLESSLAAVNCTP